MKISIGTLPVDAFVILDTGRDLTWIQCEPCVECFDQFTPILNPKIALLTKQLAVTLNFVKKLVSIFACTSGKHISIPKIPFGCGHNNCGFSNTTSGLIGLGTLLTLFPPEFYSNLEKTLVASINATRKHDLSGFFIVCYASKNDIINAPKIFAHFTNADLELSQANVFTQVDEGLICLTMLPDEGTATFGNLALANFFIGYDLVAKQVSFLPMDCTKH
ncbi:hypothetical protein CQW23_18812 [Capsicum baccatum]|uniref:Peptidase A1 domain-containing protein n=1 Tax=Capsicum baccatum TaxID=33114 RepID=A0A2G2W409_CAPBA|nr:hypothetical protein CQW23_18812 [Capsicum baccatum]